MSTTDHTPTSATERAALVPSIERALFGTTDGDLLNDDSDVPVGELRRLLRDVWAAAPAEPVWPDDIGAVLRDLRDDLMAFRVQCRDDGETLRAVGVGDALDMLAGRIAKHPRRSVSPDDARTETETTTQYVVMTTRHGEPQEIAHEERERAIEIAQSWVAPEGWGPAWVECIRTVTTSRRESEWKATDQ